MKVRTWDIRVYCDIEGFARMDFDSVSIEPSPRDELAQFRVTMPVNLLIDKTLEFVYYIQWRHDASNEWTTTREIACALPPCAENGILRCATIQHTCCVPLNPANYTQVRILVENLTYSERLQIDQITLTAF